MKQRLSDILSRDFGVDEDELAEARRMRAEQNIPISEILLKKKIISEDQLMKAYASLYDLPFWPKLPLENLDTEFARKVPIQFLKKYAMVPV
ncbi:MAG: hypothetical protein ACOCS6_03260, partial [Desulfosalsimonas sp.]